MRILVFQTAYLGDVVLTSPLLAALRSAYLDSHIACVVLPKWAPLLERIPAVDEILTFDKRGKQKGTGGTLRIAKILREKSFDIAFCPHPSFRSGLILRLAKIPKRVGFCNSAGSIFFNRLVKRDENLHEAERVLSLIKGNDLDPDNFDHKPLLTPKKGNDPAGILEPFGVKRGNAIVGIHPGSVWNTKKWLPENFAVVAERIGSMGFSVAVFGGTSDAETVSKIVKLADHENVVSVMGLSLDKLIMAFTGLSLFICNDSGPMHIAGALGLPVIAIFGSTVPAQGYAPYSEKAAVIQMDRLSCRPCGPHGHHHCPEHHFYCMKKIKPESVLIGARAMMGSVPKEVMEENFLGKSK